MGFLGKLWNDSLAGPCPDAVLGKLRETTITNSSMPTATIPEGEEALDRFRERRASAEYQRSNDEARQVMQSINISKPPSYLPSLSVDSASSPAASSPLNSPSSVTAREPENPWRSNKQYKKGSEKSLRAEPRNPTVYDWVVFTALDG